MFAAILVTNNLKEKPSFKTPAPIKWRTYIMFSSRKITLRVGLRTAG